MRIANVGRLAAALSSVFVLNACLDLTQTQDTAAPAKTFAGQWESDGGTENSLAVSGQNFFKALVIDEQGNVQLLSSEAFGTEMQTLSAELNDYNLGILQKASDTAKEAKLNLANDVIDKSVKGGMSQADVRKNLDNPPSFTLLDDNTLVLHDNAANLNSAKNHDLVFKRSSTEALAQHKFDFQKLLQTRAALHQGFLQRWQGKHLVLSRRIFVKRRDGTQSSSAQPANAIPDSYLETDPNGQTAERLNAKSLRFLPADSSLKVLVNDRQTLNYRVGLSPNSNNLLITVVENQTSGLSRVLVSGNALESATTVAFVGAELTVVDGGVTYQQQRTDEFYLEN